jgi:hypothetical protein
MSILDILRATERSRQPRLIGSKEFQGEPLHTVAVHDHFIPMDVVADARRGHAFNGMINVFSQPYFILKTSFRCRDVRFTPANKHWRPSLRGPFTSPHLNSHKLLQIAAGELGARGVVEALDRGDMADGVVFQHVERVIGAHDDVISAEARNKRLEL